MNVCAYVCVCLCGLTDGRSVCQAMTGPLKMGGKVKTKKRASQPRRIEREGREHARIVCVGVCVGVGLGGSRKGSV